MKNWPNFKSLLITDILGLHVTSTRISQACGTNQLAH